MNKGGEAGYAEMVSRQLGFISLAEQERLKGASVFVCGVGGMGGVAAQLLVRAGVGRLVIADIDTFEVSNLNRQVYADARTLGKQKAAVAEDHLRAIPPALTLERFGAEWTSALDRILASCPVAINSMDDIAAGLHLYRRAKRGTTVIDAYTSPLPNVIVVGPDAPRPETRLGFGTEGTPWNAITPVQHAAARAAELGYVIENSSSLQHFDADVAAEVIAGKRARPSYGPVVWISGALMAFHAVECLLGRASSVDHRGLFYDIWSGRTERGK